VYSESPADSPWVAAFAETPKVELANEGRIGLFNLATGAHTQGILLNEDVTDYIRFMDVTVFSETRVLISYSETIVDPSEFHSFGCMRAAEISGTGEITLGSKNTFKEFRTSEKQVVALTEDIWMVTYRDVSQTIGRGFIKAGIVDWGTDSYEITNGDSELSPEPPPVADVFSIKSKYFYGTNYDTLEADFSDAPNRFAIGSAYCSASQGGLAVFRGFDVNGDNYEVVRNNYFLISSTAASKVDFTFLSGNDPSVIVFAYSTHADLHPYESIGTFVRVAYETGPGSYELGEEFSALAFEPPQLAVGIVGRKDAVAESQVLLAYSDPTQEHKGVGTILTYNEPRRQWRAPPGNLFFTYLVQEYSQCSEETGVMTREEIDEAALVRQVPAVPYCEAVCKKGCLGPTCRCDEAARAAPEYAICAPIEECWELCTQFTLNSPTLCDGVDYDPLTRQCFLTRSCPDDAVIPSDSIQHWKKVHGAACLEAVDYALQNTAVGRLHVSRRAELGQTYLLEPDVPQVLDIHGNFMNSSDMVMVVPGSGECGMSKGEALTPIVAPDGTMLTANVSLARGEYKVCFCDLDLATDCSDASSFIVQVGKAYVSNMACLSAVPTFVQAVCAPQEGGGLRCGMTDDEGDSRRLLSTAAS